MRIKLLFPLFLLLLSVNVFAEVLVGVINIQTVLTNTNEGKELTSKLKKEFEKRQKTIQGEENALKEEMKRLQKQTLVMKEDAKRKKQIEMDEKLMKLRQKMGTYQKEMAQMEQKFKKPMLDKISKIATEVSKAMNVDFTVETNTAPIIYAKKQVNITKQVIDTYNKKHSKKK